MIWYTPTDKRDVWYMHADIALYCIRIQSSTVWYTLADIALYDINPHACNPVRCCSHACQRLVSATCSRSPAVLRCTVLMHNNSSRSSHYTAYTHTPEEMALYGIHLQTRAPYGTCARLQSSHALTHASSSYMQHALARPQASRCMVFSYDSSSFERHTVHAYSPRTVRCVRIHLQTYCRVVHTYMSATLALRGIHKCRQPLHAARSPCRHARAHRSSTRCRSYATRQPARTQGAFVRAV